VSQPSAGTAPKILLISGVRPGAGHVGEIILRDLCRAYPKGRVCFYHLFHAGIPSEPDPELAWMETRVARRRFETPYRPVGGALGSGAAMLGSQLLFRRQVRRHVRDAVAFGREQRVDKVWAVLESPTGMAIAARVARALGVPLLAQVWDAPEFLLPEGAFDPLVRRQLLAAFGRALHEAERTAVVSHAMKDEYEARHGARSVVVHHGLAAADRRPAALHPVRDDELRIGYAGSMNAPSAWQSLLRSFDATGWRLDGRRVVVRVLGPSMRMNATAPLNVEFLGYRSTADTAAALAECDVTYLPHPFEHEMTPFARFSFPTKLSTYAAAARPILVHAPAHSSLTRFFAEHPVGALVQTLEPAEITAALRGLMEERTYAAAAETVAGVAANVYNMERFQRAFAEFVGLDPAMLALDPTA
jgi:hypothetical protein